MEEKKMKKGAVLITGASRGLGRHMALYLNAQGFRVFAGYRRQEHALSLQNESHDQITPVKLDVVDPESIQKAYTIVSEAVGEDGLYGLVNNAGIAVFGPVEQITMREIDEQLNINVKGPVAVTQQFLPLLRKAKGRIVNISSVSGFLSAPFMGIYAASKFALEALSDALRLELKPWGISVSLVQPGLIDTDIRAKSVESWALRSAAFPEAQLKLYAKGLENTGKIMSGFDQGAEDILLVSEAVYSALTEATHQPRYLAGVSAQQMKGLASLPDQEKDQALLQMWEPVATQ